MAKFLWLSFALLSALCLTAQQEGRMETDRPDQTESPFITKHKYVQAEFGLSLSQENGYSTATLPTILLKYGLLEKFELRLITEINIVEKSLSTQGDIRKNAGILPLQVGGKLALLEEKGWLPKTSLLFHLAIPQAASKEFQASKWAPSFVFSMQHTLSESVGLGYNVGAEWDGETKIPFWVYTLSPGFNIGKRWYSFVEIFGAIRRNDAPRNFVDGGLGYYINDNIKLDASAGIGISDAASDHFFSAGFSFRFH